MPKMIRSARGEMVNFDLVLIKQEIASAAAPTNVSSRENFIENRIRRRSRRTGKVVEASERDLGEEVTATHLEEVVEATAEDKEVAEEPTETTTTRRVKR